MTAPTPQNPPPLAQRILGTLGLTLGLLYWPAVSVASFVIDPGSGPADF